MNGTKKKKRRRYKVEWESLYTVMLHKIIAELPEFYLDEIRECLYRMGDGWWATFVIWKKLTHDFDYSLQVATDSAFDIDEEKRQEYMDEFSHCLPSLKESQQFVLTIATKTRHW